ncbi:MAG TPA: hypothetical protein VGG06_20090 [Thermoanaerobaculia bacterium]|jgi:hypothetical protein
MRALVSHTPGYKQLRQCAENAHKLLLAETCGQVDLIKDSVAAQFVSARDTPHQAGPATIEAYDLTVHVAHGNQTQFFVSQRLARGRGPVAVNVNEIAPGDGRARYLWLVACSVMAHGNGREPDRFNDICASGIPNTVEEANFFARWGEKNPSSGTSPLGNGIRMVCGGSTLIRPTPTLLAPVFRLTDQGFMLADAFIMGLVRESQTPLCATLANRDRNKNPLYDSTWSKERNVGGDHLHIQYPIWGERPETWAAGIPPAPSSPRSLPDGDPPKKLPVLEARIDQEAQELFARVADETGESGAIRAEHRHYEGSLLVYGTETEAGLSQPATAALARLLSMLGAGPVVDSSLLRADRCQGRVVRQQIDSFPIDKLPDDESMPFPRCQVVSEEKCRYLALVASFQDQENSGAVYEILDPDFKVLLRYETAPDTESGLSARGLRLLARGWRFEEASGKGQMDVLDIEEAKKRAWNVLEESSEPEDLEKLDRKHPSVAIGYRLHSGDGKLGLLKPYYAVSFPYRPTYELESAVETPARGRGLTVETPALED